MKIDESVIDKVLDNKAAPGEARKVAGWFVTEEGRKYLSGRLDREMEELAEEMPEDVRLPSISGMKMKQRFMSEIKRERGRRSVGRKWMWVAAVLLPFVLLSVSLLFLVNRTGIFSETEYAEISVPYGEQMRGNFAGWQYCTLELGFPFEVSQAIWIVQSYGGALGRRVF